MEKLKLISAFMLTKALRQLSNYCPTGRLSMKNLVCQKSFRLTLFGTVWGITLFPCAFELDFFQQNFHQKLPICSFGKLTKYWIVLTEHGAQLAEACKSCS